MSCSSCFISSSSFCLRIFLVWSHCKTQSGTETPYAPLPVLFQPLQMVKKAVYTKAKSTGAEHITKKIALGGKCKQGKEKLPKITKKWYVLTVLGHCNKTDCIEAKPCPWLCAQFPLGVFISLFLILLYLFLPSNTCMWNYE